MGRETDFFGHVHDIDWGGQIAENTLGLETISLHPFQKAKSKNISDRLRTWYFSAILGYAMAKNIKDEVNNI